MISKCSVDTCDRVVYARELCNPHWSRLHRNGDVNASMPIQEKRYFGEEAKSHKWDAAKRYKEHRQGIVDVIKLSSGCVDCGYNGHPEALDFDHVEDNKSAQVADLVSCTFDRLFAEIEKCDVVCANCHRIRTELRRNK